MRTPLTDTGCRRTRLAVIAATCLPGPLTGAQAQTATIYGSLGNFDVVNNTGQEACGFEVEVEGVPHGHPIGYFSAQRYGVPTVVDFTSAAGVSGRRVTYQSSDCNTSKTAAHAPGTPFGGACYQWNVATYANSGGEHFGVRYNWPTSKVTYRWLVHSPVSVDAVVPFDPPIQIVGPVYCVQPPAVANAAPVVVVVIPAPPLPPARFGEPHWMKTCVRQLALDELITENPGVVPMDAAQIETNWELLQAVPPGEGGRRRGRGLSQEPVGLGASKRNLAPARTVFAGFAGP